MRVNKITEIIKASSEMLLSKTAINTYLVFFGNGLSAFFAFVFTVTYVRSMSLSDVGYFSALLSFLLLISDLADIGIGSSLSAFLPPMESTRERLLSFFKTAFFLQLGIASFVTIVIFFFSPIVTEILFHSRQLDFLMKITAISIFLTVMSNFCQFSLSARQKFYQVAFITSFGGFIRLALFMALVLFSSVILTSTVYIQALSLLVLLVVSLYLVKFDFIKRPIIRDDLKKLFSFTYLLGIARGLTSISGRIDVLMIVAIRGPVEAGIYAIASRVISIYPLLSGSFSTVIAPKLSKFKDIQELKNFMIKVILGTIGIILTALFMIAIAQPFMVALFSDKGKQAYDVFQLLLVSMIFFIGSIPSVSLAIYYLHKPHILTVNSILQLIIVVVGNSISIPKFGRFGAAYSLIAAYGFTLILTSFLTYYYFQKRHG